MLFWFVGGGVILVWFMFADPAIDFRFVVLGALMPDVVDGLLGGSRFMHSIVFGGVLLCAVVLATRHQRRLRRATLALPIGIFLHILLDGAWLSSEAFWWPLSGWSFTDEPLPSAARPVPVLLMQEAAGLGALAWCWYRFGLADVARRRNLLMSGHLDRVRGGSGSA
jgi:membrane-bound metal-dependent hydrolase YbcI (DUF457 family)